jgi:hypothetical protein
LNFTSEYGTFQANDIEATSSYINLNHGDVILASTSDYQLDWRNNKQTFCFAAPFVAHDAISNCAVSKNSKLSSKYMEKKNTVI